MGTPHAETGNSISCRPLSELARLAQCVTSDGRGSIHVLNLLAESTTLHIVSE